MTKKETRIISITLACCGIFLIGSGFTLNNFKSKKIIEYKYTLDVTEQKIAQAKTNDLKLKNIELEINNPISLNIKDYIENIHEIEENIIKSLKLDTSMVNINQAGSYSYNISYKKKKYTGVFVIKEKELPKVELTLKNLSLEKDAALSTNISSYIVEELSDEIKNNIILNLKEVNTANPGEYQYTVTYDNKIYTAKIWIYEKQTTIITPNTPTETEEPSNTENTVNNENTENKT